MEVRFRKGKQGRTCSWEALRLPRTRVPGPTMAAGGDLPHDLHTFVIEDALALEHGFWDCVADGATFRTLGRKRTDRGRTVIEQHVEALDAAEEQVNEVYFAWRRGEPTAVDAELNDMLARWRALGEGDELVLEWIRPRDRRAPRRAGSGAGR